MRDQLMELQQLLFVSWALPHGREARIAPN
jgi:hypothetical protein